MLVVYTLAAGVFFVATFSSPPDQVLATSWLIESTGAAPGPLDQVVYFLVGVPPIASSVALLAAAHRMERPQAYRARLVGTAILAYVGSGLAAFLGTSDLFKFLSLTVMGLAASLLVLLAYYPPRAFRRRHGIDLEDALRDAERARAAFRRRSGELV